MDYERIQKLQSGLISPSKLRMKLMGSHYGRNKNGSNSNSSRTSPSKLEDNEFVRNGLLASNSEEFDEEVKLSDGEVLDPSQEDRISCLPKQSLAKENKGKGNHDSDSNESVSRFEFHKGEKSVHVHNNPVARWSYSRTMSSKWNDAEKWIMSRQILREINSKNVALVSQSNSLPGTNMARVAPEYASHDSKFSVARTLDARRVASSFSTTQMGQVNGGNQLVNPCCQNMDLKEGTAAIKSVSVRDTGTEMTPVASQEPSRTTTPERATSLICSQTSSVPSTPRAPSPTPTPLDNTTDDESQIPTGSNERELSAEEVKLKARREIVALGVQLGKMNIAAWASKDEHEKNLTSAETVRKEELEQIEIEKSAAAWEEAEICKHVARFKREEIKIQAWESQQKAKLEAEMRKIGAQIEQMRSEAQAKMVKKIAMVGQRLEEKRAAADARKNQETERTVARAEYIRQTGRVQTNNYFCCGWLS